MAEMLAPTLLTLPPTIRKAIYSYLLTNNTSQLFLNRGVAPAGYRTGLDPTILRACKAAFVDGAPLLYGGNSFGCASASASWDFDRDLSTVKGRYLKMIRDVRLRIDWGDELWMKFPLVARKIGELKDLRVLILEIVAAGIDEDVIIENGGAAEMGKTAGNRRCGGGMDRGPEKRLMIRAGNKSLKVAREGFVADQLLKVEKRVIRELVEGLVALKVFHLIGFADDEWAMALRNRARSGRIMD